MGQASGRLLLFVLNLRFIPTNGLGMALSQPAKDLRSVAMQEQQVALGLTIHPAGELLIYVGKVVEAEGILHGIAEQDQPEQLTQGTAGRNQALARSLGLSPCGRQSELEGSAAASLVRSARACS